jgi:phosphohistidine phosphatase
MKAARAMGAHLKTLVPEPSRIICSSAKRTKETLSLLSGESGWTSDVVFSTELYHASADTALDLIRSIPESIESAMLIGHQPTMGMLASWLLGGQNLDVPTCTFIHLELDIASWSAVHSGAAKLIHYVTPGQLKGMK